MKKDNPLFNTAIHTADILIPKSNIDLKKWSVVACDQYTSEPQYWDTVAELVNSEASTLNIVFPEVFLDETGKIDERIKGINAAMDNYLSDGIFRTMKNSLLLTHRTTPENPSGRWGLIAALDLEEYNYHKDSTSLIRATEGTILNRIPPRKRIREDAALELPHILVLIDDSNKTVIEPLKHETCRMKQVYNTELMMDGGSICAYLIDDIRLQTQIGDALRELADENNFKNRYDNDNVLLYAMGDGNHSLATAKSCWEDIKNSNPKMPNELFESHPARYALVEIENIFDEGITFEPIHRVLFDCDITLFLETVQNYCGEYTLDEVDTFNSMIEEVQNSSDHVFGIVTKNTTAVVRVDNPKSQIAAGTVQLTLDHILTEHQNITVDYTHGLEITKKLGLKEKNIAVFLPAIQKEDFFPAIIRDGALPRKTFSMGEANEKRYYLEARVIKNT